MFVVGKRSGVGVYPGESGQQRGGVERVAKFGDAIVAILHAQFITLIGRGGGYFAVVGSLSGRLGLGDSSLDVHSTIGKMVVGGRGKGGEGEKAEGDGECEGLHGYVR